MFLIFYKASPSWTGFWKMIMSVLSRLRRKGFLIENIRWEHHLSAERVGRPTPAVEIKRKGFWRAGWSPKGLGLNAVSWWLLVNLGEWHDESISGWYHVQISLCYYFLNEMGWFVPQYFDPPSIPRWMREILLAFTSKGNVGVTGPGWMGPNRLRAIVFSSFQPLHPVSSC